MAMNISSNPPSQLVLTFFDRVWHAPHDLAVIDELMTEDYQIHNAGTTISGRDNFKAWVGRFQQLLEDARTDSVDIFYNSEESKVVSRWVCSGRNQGIFGLPADGKDVSFTGIAIWRVEGGRLAECWVERSSYELYQQLLASQGASFV
jgi:predicted ester cyclase